VFILHAPCNLQSFAADDPVPSGLYNGGGSHTHTRTHPRTHTHIHTYRKDAMPFLGDKKGAILQSLVADKKPNLAVEVGTMAGMCVRVCVRMWVFVHVCLYIFHGRCVLYVCERMRVFVHVCLYIFPSVPFEHSLIQSYEVLDSFAQAVTSLPTFIFISYRIIF